MSTSQIQKNREDAVFQSSGVQDFVARHGNGRTRRWGRALTSNLCRLMRMGLVYRPRPAILCKNLSLNPFSHESSWPLLEVIGMETCRAHTLFRAAEGRHNTNPSLILKNLLILLFSMTCSLISIAQAPDRSLQSLSEAVFLRAEVSHHKRMIHGCLASLGQPGRSFSAWPSLD